VRHEDELWIDVLEHRLRHPQPRDHAGFLLVDAGTRLGAVGHDRARGDVAGAEVLGQGAVDHVAHVGAAVAWRSIPAAA
jgi:hypothetical protein